MANDEGGIGLIHRVVECGTVNGWGMKLSRGKAALGEQWNLNVTKVGASGSKGTAVTSQLILVLIVKLIVGNA